MKKDSIIIEEQDKGKRLDVFLTEKFPEISRSQWQKKIKNGAVLVNGEKPSVHQFLKAGDKIEITNYELRITNKKTKQPKYKLLEETKDYLIVEKPAGLLTHPTSLKELRGAGTADSLSEQVIRDYPEIKKVGEADRAGIVHRLDRDASGLLVVARAAKFFEHIKKQFADRKVKKIYLALVYGEIPKDEEDLNFVIARGSEGRMAARPSDEEGKEARTHIKILERFKNYTYLEAQIFTGRTHQIRAHLLAYGHPIVGDRMYMSRRQKIKNPGCERLFLHSHILGFENMDGKWVEYKSSPPKELKECLDKLT